VPNGFTFKDIQRVTIMIKPSPCRKNVLTEIEQCDPATCLTSQQWCVAVVGAALLLTACGGGGSASTSAVSPLASNVSGSTVDPTKLPVGDSFFTDAAPKVGFAYLCSITGKGNGFGRQGPWFNADGSTWDSTKKVKVDGAVTWVSSFFTSLANGFLRITGNGLPSHSTGVFPVAANTQAYAYDKNPNPIQARTIAWNLPANPQIAAAPTCLPAGGSIGIMLSGASLYNAADADIRDGVAWEVQDSCQGHPQGAGQYHYHNVSSCLDQGTAGAHSPLVGYVADGFGIYGNKGEDGKATTNADLDECHGHVHTLIVDGKTLTQYHYHATQEFPYAVGCYKGTPVALR
jgi:hypothetical protein